MVANKRLPRTDKLDFEHKISLSESGTLSRITALACPLLNYSPVRNFRPKQ